MICPNCGPHGHVEQVGFGNEYETFLCTICHTRYAAYPIGNGELSELVPLTKPSKSNDAQANSK